MKFGLQNTYRPHLWYFNGAVCVLFGDGQPVWSVFALLFWKLRAALTFIKTFCFVFKRGKKFVWLWPATDTLFLHVLYTAKK